AVAAADDHDALGARVREERGMRHHLVVEEVVARGHHHAAVDDHELAPVGRVVDLDRLARRRLRMQARLDAKAHGRARMFVPFGEPVGLGGLLVGGHRGFLRRFGRGRGLYRFHLTPTCTRNRARYNSRPPLAQPENDVDKKTWSIADARRTWSIANW